MGRLLGAALTLCLLPAQPGTAAAQTTPVEGLRQNPPAVHALTNVRIVAAPGRIVPSGTVVIRDGVIEAAGANVRVPADARVWDLAGHSVYPGFIDAYSDVGMRGALTQAERDEPRGAVYWNPQVRAFTDAAMEFAAEEHERPAALRSQGFTVALAVPRQGMFRGQAAALSLGAGSVAERLVRPGVAQALTFARDNSVGGGYPTSAMGAMAFVRQTLHDAAWHGRAHDAYVRSPQALQRPETSAALAALGPALRGEQPLLVETRTEEELLRVLGLGGEFSGVRLWVRGSGSEYRVIERLRGMRAPLIVPVNFPRTPDVTRAEQALNLGVAQLRHWHEAPANPARLAAAGIRFALTTDGLSDRSHFLRNVRTAVQRGLGADVALAALTTVPAEYLGISRTHGTLEAGKVANIVVAEGDVFAGDAAIESVWIDGRRFEVTAPAGADPRGQWRVASIGPTELEGTLTLAGTRAQLTGTFAAAGAEARLSSARVGGMAPQLQVAFPGDVLGHEGTIRLSGSATATALHGWGELPDGRRFNWTGQRIAEPEAEAPGDAGARETRVGAQAVPAARGAARTPGIAGARGAPGDAGATRAATAAPGAAPTAASHAAAAPLDVPPTWPAMEYGRAGIPTQPQHVLVRNATVWTMGPLGALQGADLLVTRGRVARIGRGLQAPAGAVIIEADGRHVTPGLIDAHLHSGIAGGVNEVGSAIVPEVRIGDVLTADDIWMYRQLAGGLTTAHLMHGSANPIGGQNQHIKLRWGAHADELKFEGAPRTVKFALGENVKRRTDRYPDTRMGTEQIIRDHFMAAREYRRQHEEWRRTRRGIEPRRDLRMEALNDILDGEILIMSHAYRQDEMLMLMRVAEEFGTRISSFHHGVEAFKIAPEIAAHGAAAVVWSDWSSFKIEAHDATTYNARMLIDAGVLTSLHSDDSQIASRMNWEAAKLLRTGLTEEQALALVTINPARILGIADRVGSLEEGKDGDFVIWSGNPLSTTSRAEQTWIDGRRYFDIEEDRQLREQVERERSRLIQAILSQR
jgi:imidazolonepropionase-like amidohydrolase